VQQREIAARSGVSASTVSRALNEVGGSNSEARQRVLTVARELGYWDSASRGQRGVRHLGLFTRAVPTAALDDPFHADSFYLRGVEAECRRRAIHLSYTVLEPGLEATTFVLDKVKHNTIDTVLFLAVEDEGLLRAVNAAGVRAALLNADLPGLPVDTFLPDNAGGAALGVRHLLDHGHRRILHVTAPIRRTIRRRLQAYQATLEEVGIAPDPALLCEVPAGLPEAYEAMIRWLRSRPPNFTAASCRNDLTAMALIRALRESGRRVPRDVSVVGYGDVPLAAFTDPPLTTVRVEHEELGALAVRRLIDRALDPGLTPVRFEIATRLVVRESVAPVPQPAP
jgi:DNA-binding LacI/PurR family transcriptional regulator